MANRHLSRSIVLQTLFELDFENGGIVDEQESRDTLLRNVGEFAPGAGDISFMHALLDGVIRKRGELDTIITKAAPEWPLEKISPVDRNVLRVGLYELLFADRSEVPAKVAINEAIELAKKFGGENSGKFVNGVLGAVYKEIGEPGKNEVSKKKKVSEVPYEKMPIEKLGGAVVFARDEDDVYLALVHDIFGHWTLSKGHIEDEDDEKSGVARVIEEEIGIPIAVGAKLGENEYIASHPERGKIRKQVVYYMAESKFVDLTLKQTGGLDDAKWFKLADILDLNFYDDILKIVTKAINELLKKNEEGKQ
jgi:transcription antitermination protein NusB